MLKFISGMLLGVMMFGIVVHVSRGQVATAQIKKEDVQQGDTFFLDISLDRASNFDGSLTVFTSPEDGASSFELSCGLAKDQKNCRVSNRVPLNAKLGKWDVKRIMFRTGAQPNSDQELAKKGDLSFRVVTHAEAVYPTSATVSDVQ
jgi:hypothetical protein